MTETATPTTLTAEEAEAFRQRCRAFLSQHATRGARRDLAAAREFQAALTEAGLAGLAFGTEFGGAGLTLEHERIWREVSQDFPQMTSELVISHGMCLPVLNEFGTDEQKRTYMPDNIAARTVWCQMFSEPGAGSDVASLQTKAERDGDEWIINGQKVWTTLAHESDFGVLIARTDPRTAQTRRHLDVHRPPQGHPGCRDPADSPDRRRQALQRGVLHRPARTGRQPARRLQQRLAPGDRHAHVRAGRDRFDGRRLRSASPTSTCWSPPPRGPAGIGDPVVRDQIMQVYAMETTKSLVAMRTRAEMKAGKAPGPGGSLGKLAGSMIQWRFREIAMEIAGAGSQAWEPSEGGAGELQTAVVGSFSASIAGGTDEIQRNIIGDRVLGLPRDIAVDTGVALQRPQGRHRPPLTQGQPSSPRTRRTPPDTQAI